MLIATFRLQYCKSSSGDEVDCLCVAIYARWFAVIGAFRSSLLFRLTDDLKFFKNFKTRLQTRGCQETQINNTLAEVNFDNRSAALQQKLKTRNKILHLLPNTTQRHQTLKEILLKNCYLIQNQPELNVIFPQPPIVSYKKVQSLKDMLVRAKLLRHLNNNKSGKAHLINRK